MLAVHAIQKRITREMTVFLDAVRNEYGPRPLPKPLYKAIREFVVRPGKRVRPLLLVLGYLGFAHKAPRSVYRAALSLELMHDYILAHDDIMDRAPFRRGRSSLHRLFNAYLPRSQALRFTGEDLGIIAGDLLSALALKAFHSVRADSRVKERALGFLIDALIVTGGGQFSEYLLTTVPPGAVSRDAVYSVYDRKTSVYTFSCPLAMGAALAGAPAKEIDLLMRYGRCLGRGFQIRDDIIGTFGSERSTGKPAVSDLQEGKRTILIREAWRRGDSHTRREIERLLDKPQKTRADMACLKEAIRSTGSLHHAEREIVHCERDARAILHRSQLKNKAKASIVSLADTILEGRPA